VGESLDLSGLVITATYSDESSRVITEYTTTPEAGSTLDEAGTVSVTVSYTEDEITQNASFDVEVSEVEEPES
jgi:outer membrane receptor for ferric coprogen and ferric-rhodotorulic acid